MTTRSLVAFGIVLAMAVAALHEAPQPEHAGRTATPSAQPVRCALRGVEALTHASALERRAQLHEQRAERLVGRYEYRVRPCKEKRA